MLERERKIAIRLLITGSGVRVPHNPLKEVNHDGFYRNLRLHLIG